MKSVPNADKGGGQKIPKNCGCHPPMLPYSILATANLRMMMIKASKSLRIIHAAFFQPAWRGQNLNVSNVVL